MDADGRSSSHKSPLPKSSKICKEKGTKRDVGSGELKSTNEQQGQQRLKVDFKLQERPAA
jgi:hypothetical protein